MRLRRELGGNQRDPNQSSQLTCSTAISDVTLFFICLLTAAWKVLKYDQ